MLRRGMQGADVKFQSTPPARGATTSAVSVLHVMTISIHAPREGGDAGVDAAIVDAAVFQSTPPARGATDKTGQPQPWAEISIHAPREGGDLS